MSAVIVPLIICAVFLTALLRRRDAFSDFTEGAKNGLETTVKILPSLVALMLGIGMLRSSGVLDGVSSLIGAAVGKIGFPTECIPLAVIRPFSGSGALSVFEGIVKDSGADSYAGRVASVLMGSTETTFYTVAVYFSATKIKKTSYCLISALIGDFVGFLMSMIAVKIIFY